MARGGPPPTPTKILAMRGSWRAKRRENEPEPPPLTEAPPDWLDADGKALWDKLTAQLAPIGLLTTVDVPAFARYCQLLARWIKMERFLQKNGEVYPLRGRSGEVKSFATFPQVRIYFTLSEQLLRLEQMG